MVLLDLGRLVPALRLALMLAYKPGRFDFISRLYHAIVCLSKIHARVATSESTAGKGEGTGQRESPSPAFLRVLFLIILRSLVAQGMIVF
jgi:hypothetical protein